MSDQQSSPAQSPQQDGADAGGIPQAVVRSAGEANSGRMRTRLWWLTGLCAVVAAGLIISSFRSQGFPIQIQFEQGYGLKLGDTLRFRGIDVGAVTRIVLADNLQGVEVHVLLQPGNQPLAVEGSQFWIERPRLRLGQIAGLDTVLGAKYLGVIPGDPAGKPQRSFVGIETPLAMTAGDSLEVRIRFPAGEGLEVGDPVRFRGIAVGEVTYVELSPALDSVDVGLRLVGESRSLARSGTQFWIERPRLDLTEVRGMETLIGGRYVAMQPALSESPPQTDFVGLPEPPPMPRRDGALEVELDAPRRLGLVRGAPITYRGLEVGHVANVGLSKDGASVKVTGVVNPEYAELIRGNTRWWAVGGIEIDASLRGINVSIESLSAWIRGGIAFATPRDPGPRVVTGHRFMLEPQPLPEWLEWEPRIALSGRSATGLQQPNSVKLVASWQASWLGLYRRRTAECWALVLSDERVYMPASFISETSLAESPVTIEVAGKSFPYDKGQLRLADPIASLALAEDLSVEPWKIEDVVGTSQIPPTMLIVNPELNEPLAIDQTRVTRVNSSSLKIAPGVAISEALDGSPVIDAATGKILGLLAASKAGWQIGMLAPLDSSPATEEASPQ